MKKIETIDDLRNYLTKRFPNAKIFLFGSRAKGRARRYSDVDVALMGEISSDELAIALYEIEESNFPYRVDLVLLDKASYLLPIVEKEGVRWQ